MLKTAAAVPGARMTFNLVPILLEQLDRYLQGEARTSLAGSGPPGSGRHGGGRARLSAQSVLLRARRSPHPPLPPLPGAGPPPRRRPRRTSAPFPTRTCAICRSGSCSPGPAITCGGKSAVALLLEKGENFSEREKAELLDLYDREVAAATALYRRDGDGGGDRNLRHPLCPPHSPPAVRHRQSPPRPPPAYACRRLPSAIPPDARLQVRLGLDLVAERLGEAAARHVAGGRGGERGGAAPAAPGRRAVGGERRRDPGQQPPRGADRPPPALPPLRLRRAAPALSRPRPLRPHRLCLCPLGAGESGRRPGGAAEAGGGRRRPAASSR